LLNGGMRPMAPRRKVIGKAAGSSRGPIGLLYLNLGYARGENGGLDLQPCLTTAIAVALCLSGSFQIAPAAANEAKEYYPPSRWSSTGGDMNASAFTFRDLNANGIYDLGDRPMANVAVVMSSPSRPAILRRSNISGFANFTMSASQRDSDIIEPGEYAFRAIPPRGWNITTGNQEQSTAVEILPGAPGDMIAADVLSPIGLAPHLWIDGRVEAEPERGGVAALVVITPEGQQFNAPLDGEGGFKLPAWEGTWRIRLPGGQSGDERIVEVGSLPVVLSVLRLRRSEEPPSDGASIVDFEGLMSSEAVLKLPSGHAGVHWSNWVATHNRTYEGEGYINGTMSGEYVGYNGSGHPVAIERAEGFDFIGGYFSVAWAEAEGETLHVRAWRGDELVYQDRFSLSAMGPVHFAADYAGITKLEFRTEHYWQVVADDLRLRLR
jgi:hypothetical protein